MRIQTLALILGLLIANASSTKAQPTPASPETLVRPIIATLKSGEQSADEAWKKGALNAELTVAALGSVELVNAGVALPSGDMKLARDLAQTLIDQAPETLDNPSILPARALLHLANLLGTQRDKRAVPLYEEVLKRQAKRSPEWNNQVDGALYNLAGYYSSTNQIQKAIDTKTRVYEFTTFAPMLANFELQIARLHNQAGDSAQAAQWYETAEARGTPRATGVARMDRVEALFRAGKKAQARALLLQPLGKLSPEESAKEPIQIALLTRLAQLYFGEGDLENAARYVTQAVALLDSLPEVSTDPYVVGYGPQAKRLLAQIETRQKSPFFWEQESLLVYSSPQGRSQPQRVVLHFKTAPKGEVEFTCDNPAILIEPVVATAPGQNPSQRVVYISLVAGDAKEAFNTVLVARSPQFEGHEARLPIRSLVLTTRSPIVPGAKGTPLPVPKPRQP